MAIIVSGDVDWDDQEMNEQLKDMGDRMDDLKPVFRDMERYFEQNWSENFLNNGLAVGGWAPLDAEYAAWKAANVPGAPPMIRSESLFNSIRNLRGTTVEIRDKDATFGTNIKYAKFHQYGTTKMPKREFIYEPSGFRKEWGEKIADYIADGQDGS